MSTPFKFIDHGKGGPASCMQISEREIPQPAGRQVLIAVHYAGVNRPDILQRSGLYPPPPGASPYLGLEVSGFIADRKSVVEGKSVTVQVEFGGRGIIQNKTIRQRIEQTN